MLKLSALSFLVLVKELSIYSIRLLFNVSVCAVCTYDNLPSHLVFNADHSPSASQQHLRIMHYVRWTLVRLFWFSFSLVFDSLVRFIASIQFGMMWKKLCIFCLAIEKWRNDCGTMESNRIESMGKQQLRLYFSTFVWLSMPRTNTQWWTISVIVVHIYAI